MANVYYALHISLDCPVVIKVMHPHLARDADMRERFRREAESAAQLVHPHICSITDFGSAGDQVYLVMPYLAREPWLTASTTAVRFPPSERRRSRRRSRAHSTTHTATASFTGTSNRTTFFSTKTKTHW